MVGSCRHAPRNRDAGCNLNVFGCSVAHLFSRRRDYAWTSSATNPVKSISITPTHARARKYRPPPLPPNPKATTHTHDQPAYTYYATLFLHIPPRTIHTQSVWFKKSDSDTSWISRYPKSDTESNIVDGNKIPHFTFHTYNK